ncbi:MULTISPECIES: dTDP-4-amino-4,6-dideoxygalactose transaminase [Gracilibacillus]|uniref:dTDP-4-amino-4,6-dideoxygalactose transaminase n=1 Tax=Gracilibacillus TaxID=74385 RepID=UPI000826057C|nr:MULTISPECIES: dTDP-4-amino-4,6-dideoxygalactose transaminase [Gracilibacillus]
MIPFNKPCYIGEEEQAIAQAIANRKMSGNGVFGKQCAAWLEQQLHTKKALLTPSCTAALEMCALLIDIQSGDEVIMPSYTFVSTANAFALRGAQIVFVDVDPATMNIDPEQVRAAVTERTKAIMVVHYAGVACDMDRIMAIANQHKLWVMEDAAQALMSQYNGQPLGTIGHLGTISFHETKNYGCGEGGALLVNDKTLITRAEIIQEKGTDRSQFIRGEVDKYSWRDIGSSYLLSELNAAYLSVQLDHAEAINQDRLSSWYAYEEGLRALATSGMLEVPYIPAYAKHNAHLFFIKTVHPTSRPRLMEWLTAQDIMTVTHYVPLHTSTAGKKYGRFHGIDRYTTNESNKLLRLPLYYGMSKRDVAYVVEKIQQFYEG